MVDNLRKIHYGELYGYDWTKSRWSWSKRRLNTGPKKNLDIRSREILCCTNNEGDEKDKKDIKGELELEIGTCGS